MSIDIKAVQSKFINIAKDRIGQYLTQISTSGGDIPAVIPARSNKTKPPYRLSLFFQPGEHEP